MSPRSDMLLLARAYLRRVTVRHLLRIARIRAIALVSRVLTSESKRGHAPEAGLDTTNQAFRTLPLVIGQRADVREIFLMDFRTEVAALLEEAQQICQGEVRIFGERFRLGTPIRWREDPKSGFEWPLRRWQDVPLQGPGEVDVKYVWELNCHHHLVTLARAFYLTDDERYYRVLLAQIEDWIEENPIGQGINWTNALEVGLRLLSWTLVASIVYQCGMSLAASSKLQGHLKAAVNYVLANLSNYKAVPNCHVIGEVASVMVAVNCFPDLDPQRRSVATASAILEKELARQVSPDGVSLEHSLGYHRFVLELLLLVEASSRNTGWNSIPVVSAVASKMATYLSHAMLPDGTTPMIGDSDDSHAFRLTSAENSSNARPVLATAATLLARPDLKHVAGAFSEEALWITGPRGKTLYQDMSAREPASGGGVFRMAGHFCFRNRWDARGHYLFVRAGEFGLGGDGHCAHSHADLLGFVVALYGVPILIDSGTYRYNGAPSFRSYFRSAVAHNTVRPLGVELAKPGGTFWWIRVPKAHARTCASLPLRASLTAVLVAEPWRFERSFRASWEPLELFIETRRVTPKQGSWEWFLHFPPELDLRVLAPSRLEIQSSPRMVLEINPPNYQMENAWHSPRYGSIEKSLTLRGAVVHDTLTFRITTAAAS